MNVLNYLTKSLEGYPRAGIALFFIVSTVALSWFFWDKESPTARVVSRLALCVGGGSLVLLAVVSCVALLSRLPELFSPDDFVLVPKPEERAALSEFYEGTDEHLDVQVSLGRGEDLKSVRLTTAPRPSAAQELELTWDGESFVVTRPSAEGPTIEYGAVPAAAVQSLGWQPIRSRTIFAVTPQVRRGNCGRVHKSSVWQDEFSGWRICVEEWLVSDDHRQGADPPAPRADQLVKDGARVRLTRPGEGQGPGDVRELRRGAPLLIDQDDSGREYSVAIMSLDLRGLNKHATFLLSRSEADSRAREEPSGEMASVLPVAPESAEKRPRTATAP